MKRLFFYMLSVWRAWLVSLDPNKAASSVAGNRGLQWIVANALTPGSRDNSPVYLDGIVQIHTAMEAVCIGYSHSGFETLDCSFSSKIHK